MSDSHRIYAAVEHSVERLLLEICLSGDPGKRSTGVILRSVICFLGQLFRGHPGLIGPRPIADRRHVGASCLAVRPKWAGRKLVKSPNVIHTPPTAFRQIPGVA